MKKHLLAGISVIALTISGAVIAEEAAPKSNADKSSTEMKNNSEMAPAPTATESKAITPVPSSSEAKATTDSKSTTTTTEKSTTTSPSTAATTTTTPSATTAATSAASGDTLNYATTQNSSDFRSTKMVGLNVYNSKAEKIGDINDLIIGADGSITHAVVGVGGFLGMGEKNVAVPFRSIKMNRDKDGKLTAMIDSTKEALKSAPTYKFFGSNS